MTLSVPAVTPVTMPVLLTTVAMVLFVDDHTPPVMPSLSVMDASSQTVDKPDMVPADGNGFTVMVADAYPDPHVLLTE